MYIENIYRDRQNSENSGKCGGPHLVVIITNDYQTNGSGLAPLKKMSEDRKELYKIFRSNGEKFNLLTLEDSNRQKMQKKYKETIKAFRKKQQDREQYKSLFVIFSGHGGLQPYADSKFIPYIQTEAGEAVCLDEFMERFEADIGNTIPKFFLIDSCRKVPKVSFVKKGNVPNSFYAYSASNEEEAYMHDGGSNWLQEVAKCLYKMGKDYTVVEIIEEANKNTINLSHDQVQKNTNLKLQNPWYEDKLSTDGRSLCLELG